MSKVLIGVGGSGQHVVHAYLRLLALTGTRAQRVPHVYLIDADARIGGGTAGSVNLTSEIKRLHTQLVSSLPVAARPHFALIKPYFQTHAEHLPGRADAALGLNTCPEFLADIFLTDDADSEGRHAEANDRSVDLSQGMMANAKIGAVAFGLKIMQTGDDSALKAINFGSGDANDARQFSLLRDVNGANTAVVGSSFGGTGSGVIPALVRYLSSVAANQPAAVRAFMTLPWFDIEPGGASAAAARADGIDPKTRNAALGLRTYLKELDAGIARANYVVAQFMGPNAKRPDRGNSNQGEDPHVFNLVLATSIQSFLWNNNPRGVIDGDSVRRKLFGMIAAAPDEMQGRFDAATSPHLRFHLDLDENVQVVDIARDAEVLALSLAQGAEYIRPGPSQFSVEGGDRRPEPEALRELCKVIASVYDNKALVDTGILFKKTKVAPPEVYGKIADALLVCSQTLRRSLLWLDQHKVSEAHPQGMVWPRFDHLFDQHAGAAAGSDIIALKEESLKSRWKDYGLRVVSRQHRNAVLEDKTPRISQAFTLFINAFFSEHNFISELDSLVANQPESPVYQVVAEMLMAAVQQEVIGARQATRHVDFIRDALDIAPPNRVGEVFVRSLRVDARPESSRLCIIDKAVLDSAIGDKDRSDYQSPLQEKHPLSLRQIDPYLGAARNAADDVAAIYALSKGTLVFPETSTKGIPNVLAPKLVQQWRLERRPFAEADRVPFVQTPGVRSLRSSEFGLYLHARRIIEAAFWLLFTDDPRFELRDENRDQQLDQALVSSPIARLIDREMRIGVTRQGQNLLPRYVLSLRGANKERAIPVFVNDAECAWFLAANSTARKMLAKVLPDLPSVKYGTSMLDYAWRENHVERDVTLPERGSYDANMITAFHAFLSRVRDGYEDSGLLWASAVGDICDALKPLLDPTAPPIPTTGAGSIELLADRFGAFRRVGIERPSALSGLRGLFVDNPVYFFVGDEAKREERWAGLWPLKGSAWQYVRLPLSDDPPNPMTTRLIRASDPTTNERSMWEIRSIRLDCKGLGIYEFKHPFGGLDSGIPGSSEKIDSLPWAAAVWPNFEVEDWTFYLAGGYWQPVRILLEDFDLQGKAFAVEGWKLVFYGDILSGDGAGSFGEIGRVEMRMPVKLRGRPRAVEVLINDRVLGSMPIRLGHTPEATQTTSCDVAIDFGTSNTCMAIKSAGKLMPENLALLTGEPMPGDTSSVVPDFTALVGPAKSSASKTTIAEQQFRTPQSPLFFYQSFNRAEDDKRPHSIPSELINLKSSITGIGAFLSEHARRFEDAFAISPELVGRPAELRQAMVTPHFTPFPPNPNGLENISDLARFLNQGLFRDFKWTPPGTSPSENVGLRAVYLEQLLVAGAATLRWANIRSVRRFVATYPGAFSNDQKNKYTHDLGLIVDSVFEATGIKLGQRVPIARSETVAALAASNPGGKRMMVTIDMGGGTSDFGFIVPNMRRGDNDFFSYMSSIQYAGNDLLRALLESPSLKMDGGSESDRLDLMKIRIRKGDPKLATPAVAKVAEAFFEGLFEYVFTVISAIASEPNFSATHPIEVHLFGNGFKLTEVFLNKKAWDFFDKVKGKAAQVGLISKDVASRIELVRSNRDTKLDLIQGALKGTFDPEEDERGELSEADKLLNAAESSGHNRVPVWLPCVKRPTEDSGTHSNSGSVKLGTPRERDEFTRSDAYRDQFSIDVEDIETLRKSFPITSPHWTKARRDAVAAIFHNAPKIGLMSLGQYYLSGKPGVASSYAQNILPHLAADGGSDAGDSVY